MDVEIDKVPDGGARTGVGRGAIHGDVQELLSQGHVGQGCGDGSGRFGVAE